MITPVQLSGDDFTSIGSVYNNGLNKSVTDSTESVSGSNAFDSILSAAVDMYKETDSLQKSAEEEEISFALGYTDNITDVALAERKANISLQYTTKITNSVVTAYKDLMNMQL
jgi:flagellar hook-basal body complex protein FliE